MSKKTTVKPISLGYRTVGSQESYNPVMGVLKGLTIGQDEPDSTEIEAEFYDSPFDIYYDGNPVTMTFELANYDLTDLPDLFGGEIDESDDYEGSANAYTSEWEWKLDFGRGHKSLVIYRGLTIGTLKKDADGALNYSVTITALVYNDGTTDHMYKIVGEHWVNPYPEAELTVDGGATEITPVIKVASAPDYIEISEVPTDVEITAIDNGEPLEMTYEYDHWEAAVGAGGIVCPLEIYANGEKWFTVVVEA